MTGGGGQNPRNLRLDPFQSDSFGTLLHSLLGPDPALEGLKNFVFDRAGESVLVEELVRTLVDQKVLEGARQNYKLVKPISGNEIPPTVQAVLAARIDTLPKAEKRLLQDVRSSDMTCRSRC